MAQKILPQQAFPKLSIMAHWSAKNSNFMEFLQHMEYKPANNTELPEWTAMTLGAWCFAVQIAPGHFHPYNTRDLGAEPTRRILDHKHKICKIKHFKHIQLNLNTLYFQWTATLANLAQDV